MSLWSRVMLIVRAKGKAALDRAEDPVEILGYADDQQVELHRQVKQGLMEVAISKRQLEQQVKTMEARVPRLDDQARRAVAAGRDDLARLALERRQTALDELAGLQTQAEEVGEEEKKLTLAEQQLAARIEEFRIHRRTLTARYSAAESQVRVKEALGEVSNKFTDITMALGRAEEKIDRMQAHASAVDSLIDSGVLMLPSHETDVVERELRVVTNQEAVSEQIRAIKAEVESKKALGSGDAEEEESVAQVREPS